MRATSSEVVTMSPRSTENDVDLAPGDEPMRAAYERDFYSWLLEQAHHLRAGRWNALDRDNLAEEIESLGREQFNKLESSLRVLLLHMLKWDYQPERRGRSWWATIGEQRLRLNDLLADNPGLRPRVPEAVNCALSKRPTWMKRDSHKHVPIRGTTSLHAISPCDSVIPLLAPSPGMAPLRLQRQRLLPEIAGPSAARR